MVVSRQTYLRRRIAVFGGLGVALATAFYLPMSLLAPLELISPALISVAVPENPAVELAWPGNGSAAIGAVGFEGTLAQSNDTSARSIASITKVITSLVVLEEKPLTPGEDGPVITMTYEDVAEYRRQIANNGSAEPVAAGVAFTQRQLLDVVLVASANNYSETMARWAFGSQTKFLAAARTWLDAHNLNGIQIVDASGLDPRNTSSPADLIELGKLALASPIVSTIVSSPSAIVPYVGMVENTNKLLGWNGIDGIKTGTVQRNNANLLFATTVIVGAETIDVIGVVLGSQSHEERDAAVQALLATAVLGFRELTLVNAGEAFASYSSDWEDGSTAVAEKSASVVTWAGTPVEMSVNVDPISTGDFGQRVGTVIYTIDGVSKNVTLTLDDPLEDPGPWWRLSHPFG